MRGAREFEDKHKNARQVEREIERHRPPGKPCRTESLFLFERRDDALAHFVKMTEAHLYELDCAPEAILHRGDMRLTDQVESCLREGRDVTDLIRAYWNSKLETTSITEVLVDTARVSIELEVSHEQKLAAWKRLGFDLGGDDSSRSPYRRPP